MPNKKSGLLKACKQLFKALYFSLGCALLDRRRILAVPG